MNCIAIGDNVINNEPNTLKIEVPGIVVNLTITEHEFNLIHLCISACQKMGYIKPPIIDDGFGNSSRVVFFKEHEK